MRQRKTLRLSLILAIFSLIIPVRVNGWFWKKEESEEYGWGWEHEQPGWGKHTDHGWGKGDSEEIDHWHHHKHEHAVKSNEGKYEKKSWKKIFDFWPKSKKSSKIVHHYYHVKPKAKKYAWNPGWVWNKKPHNPKKYAHDHHHHHYHYHHELQLPKHSYW